MQQFYSVIQYNAITLSDSKEHYSYKLQFINSARWQDINQFKDYCINLRN